MRRVISVFVLCVGCSSAPAPTAPAAPAGETTSPKESPLPYKVISDELNKQSNSIEFHALLTGGQPKHDDLQKELEFLFRHLMLRNGEPNPTSISAYLYSDEAQYKTPPRTPVGTLLVKPNEPKPEFENKVPLEFWQQIDQSLSHSDKGWKLEKKVERDDKAHTLELAFNYTEPGKDQWADALSFNQAMVDFTDTAKALFEGVPELTAMTFDGRWKDEDVLKISLDRATYQALKIPDIEEQIGQLHGRAFLEMATGRSSDAKADKDNKQRLAAVYKKLLAGLKGHASVSAKLK
jgi:hypothetical protein